MKMNTVTIVAIVASITVAAGIITTVILVSEQKEREISIQTIADYKQFYDQNASNSDQFEVVDVYMRPDNTFI
jgi:hypothetical protein